jgi:hypothetical protein
MTPLIFFPWLPSGSFSLFLSIPCCQNFIPRQIVPPAPLPHYICPVDLYLSCRWLARPPGGLSLSACMPSKGLTLAQHLSSSAPCLMPPAICTPKNMRCHTTATPLSRSLLPPFALAARLAAQSAATCNLKGSIGGGSLHLKGRPATKTHAHRQAHRDGCGMQQSMESVHAWTGLSDCSASLAARLMSDAF